MATYNSKLRYLTISAGVVIILIGVYGFINWSFDIRGILAIIAGLSYVIFGSPKLTITGDKIKYGLKTKNVRDITKIDIIKVTEIRRNMIIHFDNGVFIINRYDLFKDFLPELRSLTSVKVNEFENRKEKQLIKKQMIILFSVTLIPTVIISIMLKQYKAIIWIGLALIVPLIMTLYYSKSSK